MSAPFPLDAPIPYSLTPWSERPRITRKAVYGTTPWLAALCWLRNHGSPEAARIHAACSRGSRLAAGDVEWLREVRNRGFGSEWSYAALVLEVLHA